MKTAVTVAAMLAFAIVSTIALTTTPKRAAIAASAPVNAQEQTQQGPPDLEDSKYIDVLPNIIKTFTQVDLPQAGASGSATTTTGGNTPPAPGGPVTGTPDGPVTIDQTVLVRGIRVHTSMAANTEALLAAAQAAGLDISGSGWRDPQEQIALRRQNCGTTDYDIYQRPSGECSPPTARPGTSNHERGTAIDFTCGGDTMRAGDACFNWMVANAAKYNYYNLPAESWHWSVNGS
ncbi:D-alanyl-D-alanine carboxypeptidase family protein [Candidatus Microgenomates bacterium]|nr:D-alanyl-D-alanine carboxypeptidase family protein [Candidatus Microgenomates bacterium]